MFQGLSPAVGAGASGRAVDIDGKPAAVFSETVQQLYSLSPPTYGGSLLGGAAAVAVLWPTLSSASLLIWGAFVAGVMLARYTLYRTYMQTQRPRTQEGRWSAYFIAGAAIHGAVWGVLGSALYPVGALPQELMVVLIVSGMAMLSILVLAPVRWAFLAFIVPSMLPLIATVFVQGSSMHVYVGLLLVAFVAVVTGAGLLVSRMMRDAISMKFDNSELVARLSDSHSALHSVNQQLNEQIDAQHRTADQLRETSRKLGALVEASPLAIIVRDMEGRIESWNPAARRMFGWTEAEVRGFPAPYHPTAALDEGDELRRRIVAGEAIFSMETVRLRKDGRCVDVVMSAALVHDAAGRPTSYLTMMFDNTERKRTSAQQNAITQITMKLSEAQSIDEAIPDLLEILCTCFGFVYGAFWTLDRHSGLLRCAEARSEQTEALELFCEQSRVRAVGPEDTDTLHGEIRATRGPVWVGNLSPMAASAGFEAARSAGLRCAFGFPVVVSGELYGTMEFLGREARAPEPSLIQAAQNVSAHIGQFIARKQAERNLQFVASHDALTGLLNRVMFGERLQQALAQAQRHDRKLAVLFMDLDGFKLVNDMHGHDAGDALLAELAHRLRECMREGDTLGRLGGDEFVVLIEGIGTDTQLVEVARKILDTVAQPFLLREGTHGVTASIGIAMFPQDARDAPALLKNADLAMYRAKQQGKNNFRFYSAQMNTHLVERVGMAGALRNALENDEMTLFYQPRMRLPGRGTLGAEALLRWRHPTQGLLTPAEFMPIAEETGLFNALSDWTLRTACRQLREWQPLGVRGMRMAVNVSSRQFAQEDLIDRLREAIHASGVHPKDLEIEITEATLMRHAELAGKLLFQVRELGARVLIDDFGTGYSSLGCLKRFPIDGIKIDHTLVAQVPGALDASALVRAVVAMGRSLDLEVTAEGVETASQCEFLLQNGCEIMQGNYFCPPAPADVAGRILQEQPTPTPHVHPLRPWRKHPERNGR